jgi:hypothetical protein
MMELLPFRLTTNSVLYSEELDPLVSDWNHIRRHLFNFINREIRPDGDDWKIATFATLFY